MKTKIYAIFIMISMLLLGVVNLASAQPPGLPSSFYGEILILDDAPEEDDIIEVYVGTVDDSPETTTTVLLDGSDLVYTVNVPNNNYTTSPDVIFVIAERIVAIGKWSTGENQELEFHPPAAEARGPYVGLVGESITLSGSATDSLSTDTFTYAWDLDNDGSYDDSIEQKPSSSFSSIGTKTIGLKVTDSQGGEGTDTTDIIVASVTGLSYTYDGTPKSVTVTGVSSPYTYEVTYGGSSTAPVNAGSYAVVVKILSGTTTVGTIEKTLVINTKSITVTADPDKTKVFGESDPTFTYTSSDTGVSFIGALSRVSGEDVGTYAITVGSLSAGSNYSITFVPTNFTITAKPITVTADPGQSKVFGAGDPVFTYTSSNTNATFTGDLGRVVGENVGTYAITIGNLSAGSNYSINFVPADFTISAKPITVTATAGQTKVFGTNDPVFAYTSSETGITFTGALSRVSGEGVGTYAITIGSLTASSNYSINFVSADFTITALQHSIDLSIGWNLVSFNLIPVDTNIEAVLASVAGNYDLVYAWDATAQDWLLYDPNVTISQDLEVLDNTMGLWIHMTAGDTLDIVGTLPSSTSITLASGWNLVGYPSATSIAASTVGQSPIYAYHANDADGWKIYDSSAPSYVNDLTTIQPGWGYWIFSAAGGTWNVTN